MMLTPIQLAILILGFSLGLGASARPYSIPVDSDYPKNVYWGDTHLHTAASGDAFGFGNKLNDEEAYKFARGEEITSAGGLRVKLSPQQDWPPPRRAFRVSRHRER